MIEDKFLVAFNLHFFEYIERIYTTVTAQDADEALWLAFKANSRLSEEDLEENEVELRNKLRSFDYIEEFEYGYNVQKVHKITDAEYETMKKYLW